MVLIANLHASFYTLLRFHTITDKTSIDPPPWIDLDTKNRICHHIGNSGFFTLLKEKPIYMYEMYEKLRYLKPDVLLTLYERTTSGPTDGRLLNMVYVNRTEPVDVIVLNNEELETIRDYAFICPTTDEDQNVFPYLVSMEYNLSDDSDSYIAGRFLFYKDDDLSEMYALAEEPARSLSTPGEKVERAFLQNRADNEPCKSSYT